MTTEALDRAPAPTTGDARWRDVVAVVGARLLARLRRVTDAIRPLAWVLMALAIGLWILGQSAGWAEFTIAAAVIAITVAL